MKMMYTNDELNIEIECNNIFDWADTKMVLESLPSEFYDWVIEKYQVKLTPRLVKPV